MTLARPAVVALGGGHGLSATLTALKSITVAPTAVVTVADDGGSSGRLRQDRGVLPPGDLRMALAALAAPDVAQVLQHRFDGNDALAGHPLGNLLLTALWELDADPVGAVDRCRKLLSITGRVLPMVTEPVDIEADIAFTDGRTQTVRGQAEITATRGRIARVRLVPAAATACAHAVDAIAAADCVVLGPGSWYTSVIPTILVPGLREALSNSVARRVLVLNLVAQPGETDGFDAADLLRTFRLHAQDVRIDTVVADVGHHPSGPALQAAAAELGAELVTAELADHARNGVHDAAALGGVLRRLLEQDL